MTNLQSIKGINKQFKECLSLAILSDESFKLVEDNKDDDSRTVSVAVYDDTYRWATGRVTADRISSKILTALKRIANKDIVEIIEFGINEVEMELNAPLEHEVWFKIKV